MFNEISKKVFGDADLVEEICILPPGGYSTIQRLHEEEEQQIAESEEYSHQYHTFQHRTTLPGTYETDLELTYHHHSNPAWIRRQRYEALKAQNDKANPEPQADFNICPNGRRKKGGLKAYLRRMMPNRGHVRRAMYTLDSTRYKVSDRLAELERETPGKLRIAATKLHNGSKKIRAAMSDVLDVFKPRQSPEEKWTNLDDVFRGAGPVLDVFHGGPVVGVPWGSRGLPTYN